MTPTQAMEQAQAMPPRPSRKDDHPTRDSAKHPLTEGREFSAA
jgi:hypothetical protein